MCELYPSLLAADFSKAGQQLKELADAGVGALHLDVMDGSFVPNISFGMPVIASLRKTTDLLFDVHMMVNEPIRFIDELKDAGADMICVHQEACTHLDATINKIKSVGCRAGIALNPATPLGTLDELLGIVDYILIMLVNPGYGGQKLIPYTVGKVERLRQKLTALGLSTDIEVDGGITPANVGEITRAGATMIVAGSALFQGEIKSRAGEFLQQMKEGR